uniref:Hydroxyproline O-arabinosyltransferase-like domain-containing protein n=1 Tax=Hyaloperonospora arabidopsidis (strain Emoy2) TaxID=559515 RepID=M4BPK4_HYAAE
MLTSRPPPRRRSPCPLLATRKSISIPLLTLTLVFALDLYLNLRFFASSSGATTDAIQPAPLPPPPPFSSPVPSTPRLISHVVFTSTCRELDFLRAEVLAFTLRRSGSNATITHLLYGCSTDEAAALTGRKDPRHHVQTRTFPEIAATRTTFGEKLLTTTLHVEVLAKWVQQESDAGLRSESSLNKNEDDHFKQGLAAEELVMAVDSDAIFTKQVNVENLLKEAKGVVDPRIFGQDASWYWPFTFPLTIGQLKNIVPRDSHALQLKDWREYAAIAPFIAKVGAWQEILPTAVDLWKKLALEQRHLAVPIAAAHFKTVIGISSVLSIHHYPSRYQNWDFSDDVKHNPCKELAKGKDLALSSYPISIRALNFTLPQWIDGREWSFFADQVPLDFLSCDAWMMRQPSGYMWHLASHTSGYERVPNVLRRRHMISVCLAVEAYNSASESYRSRICPTGYNHNRRIPMEFREKTWSTAVALADGSPMEVDPPVFFGDYKRKQNSDVPNESDLKLEKEDSDELHFVFTTSCEPDQNWQSEALAQSFARVGQRGVLTRIVSGCSIDAEKELLRRTYQSAPHLRIHVTRDFRSLPAYMEASDKTEKSSIPDDYVPYNKPFGLRDWLESANPPVREDLVVVLDPDFLFIRQFAVNTGGRVTSAKGVDSGDYVHDAEVIEGMRQYKRFFVYSGSRKNASDTVTDGVAVAQRWSQYLGTTAFENSSLICPKCAQVSKADAAEFYAVGPPCAITRKDLTQLMDDYCNMTVLKREQMNRESWMSEMLGYSLAAAKHEVKHTMFDNLALGNKEDDYTGFVRIMKGDPCADPVTPVIPGEAPPLLHMRQPYEASDDRGFEWLFDKQLLPHNLFACDSWLLASPPASVWSLAKQSSDKQRLLEAYGVCTSIKVFNQALVDFKTKMCPNGFNENRRLRLVKDDRQDLLMVGNVHMPWQKAAQENAPEGA